MDRHPPPYRGLLTGREPLGSKAKRHAMQCEDRISNLPGNLIGRILSFLPTEMAVATSVLSTRWKQFWTLVTSVDFDDKLILQRQKSNRAALQMIFASFVDRVLERVSCLDKFRLKCCQSYDVSHVNAWVAAPLKYPIEELDLSIPVNNSTNHVAPLDLSSCRTLVVLKLGTKFMLNVPASVCLSSLKILHLDSVKFSDDDSIKRLLLGCPVLDELSMNGCVGKDVHVINISAPVLTKLRYCNKRKKSFYSEAEYKVVIDTPALLYLELIDYEAEVYLVKNLSHIVKADICIAEQYDETDYKGMTDLLMGISEVQSLHLYNSCREVVHKIYSELPIFHNLSSLVLGAGYVRWVWLSQLLAKSPCLERLVFKEGYHIEYDEDACDDEDDKSSVWHDWHPPRIVPSCLLSNLKVIRFLKFQGGDGDLRLAKYFLKNTEVLEKLIIHYKLFQKNFDLAEDQLRVATQLLMLPRGSRACRIKFVTLRDDESD
ncbi:FBD-associated F-box protein At4g10400-like [Rhododendron vialii]|uniref:FBD-associated F-box protein At4g10400-like n=1 Tax=Rhododendron vialii TaxID=182163 RepID=UPI00266001C5|nr:FBD-associated F-box protein At4g10400-like [Rhododendron vialii]